MKVTRKDAVVICESLGYSTARSWNRKKMRTILVEEVIPLGKEEGIELPGDVEDFERLNGVLKELIESGGEGLELVERSVDSAKENAEQKQEANAEQKQEANAEQKQEANAEQKPVGVRNQKTRLYCAGVVIKRYGHDVGVTDEMVQEVNELFGKNPNDKRSREALGFAWGAINGYLNG